MNIGWAVGTLIALSPMTASAWDFTERTDDMTGKPIRQASTISQNELDLGWPYGVVSGYLVVRTHPRYGRDVILQVEKGHMLCHSYGECPVLARFDDRQPLRITGNPPEDGSTEVIFLGNYNQLVSAIRKSKIARIEANFYQHGARALVFDVTGFPDAMTKGSSSKTSQK